MYTQACILSGIDKITVQRWPFSVLFEQYTAYSVSVSAMQILFSSVNQIQMKCLYPSFLEDFIWAQSP